MLEHEKGLLNEERVLNQLSISLRAAMDAAGQLDKMRGGRAGYSGQIRDLLDDAEWELKRLNKPRVSRQWWEFWKAA